MALFQGRSRQFAESRKVHVAISLWAKSSSYKARENTIGALTKLFDITSKLDVLIEARERLSLIAEYPEDARLHLAIAQISLDIFTARGAHASELGLLEQSEHYARRAILLGEIHASDILLIELREIRRLHELSSLNAIGSDKELDLSVDAPPESRQSDEVSSTSSSSHSSTFTSPLPYSSVPANDEFNRKKVRKAEKKLRAIRRRQEQSKLLSPVSSTIESIGSGASRNLNLIFCNKNVETQFARIDQEKKKTRYLTTSFESLGAPKVLGNRKCFVAANLRASFLVGSIMNIDWCIVRSVKTPSK